MNLAKKTIVIKYKCGGSLEFNNFADFELTSEGITVEWKGGLKLNLGDFDSVSEINVVKDSKKMIYKLG